ncbi:cytochrome P450 [Streptomyces sp. KK5PA1]|uniref:Cytochrome P450 n=2 Tax=Actinacidiphila acididurans TaxID=2784346 RepID=A0ABS2TLZ1_9ACTN|nr:cytochrome P450 [Actinacidiphila acididurans]
MTSMPDPYPLLARLRAAGDVHPLPDAATPSWVVTGHAAVRAALRDGRLSSDPARGPGGTRPDQDNHVSRAAFARSMFTSDPPEHTRLRRTVTRTPTWQRIADLRPYIERTAAGLIGALPLSPAAGPADAVEALAAPLTVLTICRLLGLPSRDHHDLLRWSHELMTEQTDAATRAASTAGRQRLTGYLAGFVRDLAARHRPGAVARSSGGLVHDLVNAPPAERLTDQEILTTAMLLLVAGHETGTGLTSAVVRHLLCDPDRAAALRRRPLAVPAAVQEVLRYDGPVTMTVHRTALTDVRIAERVVPAGHHVFLCLAAANRDERAFPDPDTLLLDRRSNRHLGFGHGVHRCPGSSLALLETRVLTELLLRTADLSLAVPPDALRWRRGKVRCLDRLPVEVRARG